jgi:hypothetical protein
MGFETEVLLVRILELLERQERLLQELLKRSTPATYHATVGGSITVRN